MIGTRPRKPRAILQERDQRLLAFLELLRVATREQIAAHCGFRSRSRASARLSLLVSAGYLSRDFIGTITGGRAAVYMLPGKRIRAQRGPAGQEAAIQHQLAVNEVYLAFFWTAPQHHSRL